MNRILLLEDHEMLRISMAEALSDLPDAQVFAVGTLADAMEELAKQQPNLIVSDLDLPDGSGIELLGYLGRPPSVPVVFVSGHVPQYQSKLYGFPGITVRHKPLAMRELLELAQEHLESLGREAPFSPADYVQLACMGKHSVRIEVESTRLRGTIIVKAGQLWAANTGDLQGLPALRSMSFEHRALSRCVTIRAVRAPQNLPERSWEQLLLDAARAHDEQRHSGAWGRTNAREVEEETDFSDIFAEDHALTSAPSRFFEALGHHANAPKPVPPRIESRPVAPSRPAPIQPVPNSIPPLPRSTADDEEFALLVERGADALLAKDYFRALRLYERAYSLRPTDSLVAANIARLGEIVRRNEQNP